MGNKFHKTGGVIIVLKCFPVLVTQSRLRKGYKIAPATSPESLCLNVLKPHGCVPSGQIVFAPWRELFGSPNSGANTRGSYVKSKGELDGSILGG